MKSCSVKVAIAMTLIAVLVPVHAQAEDEQVGGYQRSEDRPQRIQAVEQAEPATDGLG